MSRLIDADALIAHQFKNDISYKAFVNLVKRQPTVEPERKTGKWIRTDKHYMGTDQEYYYYVEHCSECGARKKIGWQEANYCPNCGVRIMQEGEDNDS